MAGKLYIVGTPIGNLEDITLRALRTLKEADVIACEDTRTTRKLLSRYGIEKPLLSYHEHNETVRAEEIAALLAEGKSVALVTDAGTPCISDPGYRAVRLASERGFEVLPVPGPSAAIAALSVSGLPTSGFVFLGFPPRTRKALGEFLTRVKDYPETLVFYESPNRAEKTLKVMLDTLGDRNVSLGREITKLYEETIRGRISQVLERVEEKGSVKGEVTLIVEGADRKAAKPDSETVESLLEGYRAEGLSLKDAVRKTTEETGASKSSTYKRALEIWGKG
ncbi:MAG TPA: 16S rRNA (cytidine(1402)-2'-O)-methyltransferase [Thermodesulfobacteriota bacterium]|nr:16S rRNA (cytidine(1402)-2'-O)-methyltransferase [Thermodesulfobacteriota bacterium]